MTTARELLTSCGPDGVWRIPPDAEELLPAMFTATTTPPSLEELQGYVGGYVECVRFGGLGGFATGWLNEEGKLDGLPINALATVLAHLGEALDPRDFIAGPLLITIGKAEPD